MQKQIDSLNRSFQRMCEELLAIKQGRGQPFLFTPTGAAFASQARDLLEEWQGQVNDARHRIGKTVTLGTTEFTPRFIGTASHRVADEFAAREIELNVVHVRTKDSLARLDSKEIDILCGGIASVAGACRASRIADGLPAVDVPDESDCRSSCTNLAYTDRDIQMQREHAARLATAAPDPLAPAPLRDRVATQASRAKAIIDRHEPSRPADLDGERRAGTPTRSCSPAITTSPRTPPTSATSASASPTSKNSTGAKCCPPTWTRA